MLTLARTPPSGGSEARLSLVLVGISFRREICRLRWTGDEGVRPHSKHMDKWTSGAAYDQWMGRWSQLLAHEFLNWLAPSLNLRWLDVCCGSGVLTEAIVRQSTPSRVTGIDASSHQIEFARAHRASPATIFETGDAMALPFSDASFDLAVCGLGLNFIPQPKLALEEMRRVTVPDAVIAVYVWDYAEGARFLRTFWDVSRCHRPRSFGLRSSPPLPHVQSRFSERVIRKRFATRRDGARTRHYNPLRQFRRLLAAIPHRTRFCSQLSCQPR